MYNLKATFCEKGQPSNNAYRFYSHKKKEIEKANESGSASWEGNTTA